MTKKMSRRTRDFLRSVLTVQFDQCCDYAHSLREGVAWAGHIDKVAEANGIRLWCDGGTAAGEFRKFWKKRNSEGGTIERREDEYY